jgi:hypothetical protein
MAPTPSTRPGQRHHVLNALLREKTRTKDRMSQFLDEKLRSQLKHTKEKKTPTCATDQVSASAIDYIGNVTFMKDSKDVLSTHPPPQPSSQKLAGHERQTPSATPSKEIDLPLDAAEPKAAMSAFGRPDAGQGKNMVRKGSW